MINMAVEHIILALVMVGKIFLLQQQNLKTSENNSHPCSWFNKAFAHLPQFNTEVIVKKAIELFKQRHYLATGHSFFFWKSMCDKS